MPVFPAALGVATRRYLPRLSRRFGLGLSREVWLVQIGVFVNYFGWGGLMPFLLEAGARSGIIAILPHALGVPHFAIVTILTVALSALSWHLFEQPINSLKQLVPYVGRSNLRNALRFATIQPQAHTIISRVRHQ